MLCYRIANKQGKGPYEGSMREWCDCLHWSGTGRPDPCEATEFGSQWRDMVCSGEATRWRFGFKDEAQLLRWFSVNELLQLHAMGFLLWLCVADEVMMSETQVVFKGGRPEGTESIELFLDRMAR